MAEPLPVPLQALLEHQGLRVREALLISPLKDVQRLQETYRLLLDDGRVIKGRVLRRSRNVSRMHKWLEYLPAKHFPRTIAHRGRAILEHWVNGDSLQTHADVHKLTAVGQLLAEVHSIGIPRAASERWLPRRVRELWCNLSRLHRIRLLSADVTDHLLRIACRRIPRQPTWCLTHGDCCAANLVWCGDHVCSIDNVTVHPRYQAEDLARTWYRWPMPPAQRRALLHGYNLRSVDEFLDYLPFWHVLIMTGSAAHRLRYGIDGAEQIIQRLLNDIETDKGLAA